MGILGDIGKVVIGGVLGGPAGALAVFTVEHGQEVIEGTIDFARQVVTIGEDVYRAIPPEAFAIAGDPLHGLLKHEFEDELIFFLYFSGYSVIYSGLTWPVAGPFGAAAHLYAAGGVVFGFIDHRRLNDQEWEMAQYIFRDTLPDREHIVLTNVAGIDGRPFTFPIAPLGVPVVINLAGKYDPHSTTPDGALLYHEMTHVWQAKRAALREVYLYDARVGVTREEPYDFNPGKQWREYQMEQQAAIVEAWTLGATQRQGKFDPGVHDQFALATPLFRYVNGNIRRSSDADTSSGQSLAQLLADGGHDTLAEMYSAPPAPWWS